MTSLDDFTGEEIADIAKAQSPIKPVGLGLASEVAIYIFTILCAIVIGLRVWVRTWREESKQKWKASDYLAVIGFVPFIPASVLGILAARYGVGAPDSYLEQFEMADFIVVRGKELLIFYEIMYYGASTITKYAIAFTILQICVQKRYVYLMYVTMAVQALAAGGCMILLFVNCVPFAAYWNPKIGSCKLDNGFLILSYIGTSVQILVDWTCAITPFFIVYSLQMPRRAKISVVGVLGLGVLASVAAVMRIVSYEYIDKRRHPNDHMVGQGRLLIFSIFESSFAIIACSLPPLKKLFQTCLGRTLNRTHPTGGSRQLNNTPLASLTPHGQTRTTVSGKAKWDRLHDDDSSGRHIIQQTEVRIETASNASDLRMASRGGPGEP